MKIAIEGCAHGELEIIYNTLQYLENKENIKIDMLICCGDFQATRNLADLRCMAVPDKFSKICTFYKYFSGELKAPYLTIFIGGNHEASNYLQELPYGGWVAPNIYYMGYANVINVAGIRLGGISGIYKGTDYSRGHFEKCPYNENTKRSVYHVRNLDIYRLKQISQNLDIFLSHDWPQGIHNHGNVNQLLKKKPFFQQDIDNNKLGSPASDELLKKLKPNYWFSAHLHCKFAAVVTHDDSNKTKFLALDKCLPKRQFMQVLDIPHDENEEIVLKYNLEWLTILHLTNHLLSVKSSNHYMPGPGCNSRWDFTPSEEEKDFILQRFNNDLTVPLNFVSTAEAYDQNVKTNGKPQQPEPQTNPQTQLLCEKLSIDDPLELLGISNEKPFEQNLSTADSTSTSINSHNQFIPSSVEIKRRMNMSLPEPTQEVGSPQITKLSMTLPTPKHSYDDSKFDDCKSPIKEVDLNQDESFSEAAVTTSTPQLKKFKRRNESIYNNADS